MCISKLWSNSTCKQANELPTSDSFIPLISDKTITNLPFDSKQYIFRYRQDNSFRDSTYFVSNGEDKMIVAFLDTGIHRQEKAFWQPIKYLLYPFTFVADIITFPIQVCTMENGGGAYGFAPRCPDWTGGAGK